jgi:hypothetical protein
MAHYHRCHKKEFLLHEELQAGMSALREPTDFYSFDFGIKNGLQSGDIELFWEIFAE